MRPLVPIHQRSGAQLTRARGTEREYPRRGFSVLPDCQSALVCSWKISGRAASLFARMVGGAPADTKGPASSEVIELAPGAGFERPARWV